MKKGTSTRNSQTCTADLLSWSSDVPPSLSSFANASRSRHPNDRISKVVFGGHITDEEAETFYKRRPCSRYKLKEMNGSNIFSAGGEDTHASESVTVNDNVNNRTSVRIVQQGESGKGQISFSASGEDGASESVTIDDNVNTGTSARIVEQGASGKGQIPFVTEENISPKMPNTLTEVAKERGLNEAQESKPNSKVKKQLSDAKSKELSGSNIFGPPVEVPPRSLTVARALEPKESKDMDEPPPRTVRTSVKVSNPAGGQSNISFGEEPVAEPVKPVKKIHNRKFADLTGNDIFKVDTPSPGSSSEKQLSSAKLREMSGSGIFSDGKVEHRDHFRGVRKPPGGESSIRLF